MKHDGPNLSKHDYEVRTAPFADCRDLISRIHYSGGCANTAVFRHGLFRREDNRLVGAALWMPPLAAAAKSHNPQEPRRVITLSRLAIEDDIPRNAESFLVGRSIRLIRADGRYNTLITFADDFARHTGGIYHALGFEYLGPSKEGHTWVNAEGVRRGKKRGPRNLTNAEMEAEGFTLVSEDIKHRFRKRI